MDKTKHGGQAFPRAVTVSSYGTQFNGDRGMALRDYFAGQILAGSNAVSFASYDMELLTKKAYKIADLMIKER